MREYLIMTDGAADIPAEKMDDKGLIVIPMIFNIKDIAYEHFQDFRDMGSDEFYSGMKRGGLPTTEPLTKSKYTEEFEKVVKGGKDIIYICVSGGLSESFKAAEEAAEELKKKYPEASISVIDSKNISVGEGLLVLEALRIKYAGIVHEGAVKHLEVVKEKIKTLFFVDDIMHLKRRALIPKNEPSPVAALKVRTVYSLDEGGKISLRTKVRGNQNAIDYVSNVIKKEHEDKRLISISHAAAPDRGFKLQDVLNEKCPDSEVLVTMLGLITGTFTGPATVVAAYHSK